MLLKLTFPFHITLVIIAMNYLIIDQGTSSTKIFLFDSNGSVLHTNKIKHKIVNPRPFHIESDSLEIVNGIKKLIFEAIAFSKSISGVGIAVQRSTFLFWDKTTVQPITPAISWQDTRSKDILKDFDKFKKEIWEKTHTPLAPQFGGPKFTHLTRKIKELNNKVKNGDVFFGPLSSFIVHSLTGNALIDDSIACRSLLYNIKTRKWSQYLLNLFEVPEDCLPRIVQTKYDYGTILNTKLKLSIVIGDQQAALIGQGGLKNNYIGANFGTSGSIQYNTGTHLKKIDGLLSSVLLSNKNKAFFMIEGTINACNAIFYHLEILLNIPHKKMKWDTRIQDTNTSGIFIPGFNGLASPYWVSGFKNILIDLPNDNDQIIRAAMESIGFLTNDIINCFKKKQLKLPQLISVSGGAARKPLLQFISNVTGIKLHQCVVRDKTAMGVFKLLNKKLEHQDMSLSDKKVFSPIIAEHTSKKVFKWSEGLKKNNIRSVLL